MPPAFALSQDQTLQFRVRQRSPCEPRIFTRMSAWHNRHLPKQITVGHKHQLPMQPMPGRRQTCRLEFQGSHILEAYPTVHFSKSHTGQGEGSPWPPASGPLVRTRGLYPASVGCQRGNVNLGKSSLEQGAGELVRRLSAMLFAIGGAVESMAYSMDIPRFDGATNGENDRAHGGESSSLSPCSSDDLPRFTFPR